MKKKLAFILGIRPDVIRASIILNLTRSNKDYDLKFIWSGQHYADNLKDIFFRELNVKPPDIELNASGSTDAEVTSAVIARLYKALEEMKPEAAIFLGDTNTVMGCLAAAQLNIPIVHIEGCMRSYDWRMPEEKYRTVSDHVSDVIYTYLDEYKVQGINEGLNPANIVVVGNPIVDILDRYYFQQKKKFDAMAGGDFFKSRGLEKSRYYLMTCHRRENVQIPDSFKSILMLVGQSPYPVYFPASYRTQKVLKEMGLNLPGNVQMVDPIGYTEMLCLMVNSRGVLTDSGTVVEETCILNVPSVQMRRSTERPQVYDAGSSVKFDPASPENYPAAAVYRKLDALYGKKWQHNLGDGKASERIVADLEKRLANDGFRGHQPEQYHIPIDRSYREDDLKL